jgi:dihydrofolate reductase
MREGFHGTSGHSRVRFPGRRHGGPGQDLLIYGSGELVRTLTRHNLIDEYRLLVHPVILGSGKRLFKGVGEAPALKLADTVTFSSGVVSLVYEPAR